MQRDSFIAKIERSRTLELPEFEPLSEEQLADIRENPLTTKYLPEQESGTRPSCALPYELQVDGVLDREQNQLLVCFECSEQFFGESALGAPFNAYAPGWFSLNTETDDAAEGEAPKEESYEKMRRWSFAVKVGDKISYYWPLAGFSDQKYQVEIHGPNGFFREMRGDAKGQEPEVHCENRKGNQLVLKVKSPPGMTQATEISVEFLAYYNAKTMKIINPGEALELPISLIESSGWYDLQIKVQGNDVFSRRYAGRVENGESSITDPMIGAKA